MSKTDYLIVVADHPSGNNRGWPDWQRSAVRDPLDGVSYAPAVITGRNEAHVFLSACSDGIETLRIDDHSYYPTAWLKKTYDAQCAESCRAIERCLDEASRWKQQNAD
jgi:hypothetical protein